MSGWLNRHDDRAGASFGEPRDEVDVDVLVFEEVEDEVADLIGPNGREQRRSQAEASCADADICRTTADVCVEARTPVIGTPISWA